MRVTDQMRKFDLVKKDTYTQAVTSKLVWTDMIDFYLIQDDHFKTEIHLAKPDFS